MNCKNAKLLRKAMGVKKLDRKTKRMYYSLSHIERGMLTTLYHEGMLVKSK